MSKNAQPKNIDLIAGKLAIILSICILLIGGSGGYLFASSDSKHDEVLKFRQSNDILPFNEILEIIVNKTGGEIIETEFEYKHGVPIYEFKYISKSGRVREVYVDAKTGRIIKDEPD